MKLLNKIGLTLLPIVTMCCLSACGGGGSSDSASSPSATPETPTAPIVETPETFIPDETKREKEAEDSSELYVDPGFIFDMTQSVTFMVTPLDSTVEPLQNVKIEVYKIDNSIESLEEITPADKQLLFIGRTDINGNFEVHQEIPPNTNKVLAIASVIGVNNSLIIPVDSNILSMSF